MKLLHWIVLVLSIVIVWWVAIAFFNQWNSSDLAINLATEITGVFFTVIFVDWLLRLSKEKEWLPTQTKIHNRLLNVLNITVGNIVPTLISDSFSNSSVLTSEQNVIEMQKQSIKQAKDDYSLDSIKKHLEKLDSSGWDRLIEGINIAHDAVDRFITTYLRWLKPNQCSLILHFQDRLYSSVLIFEMFKDDLQYQIRTPSSETQTTALHKETGNKHIAQALSEVFNTAEKIVNTFTQ